MADRLQNLMFRLRLIDEASGPAGKVAKRIDDLTSRASASIAKIGVGAAGVWGTAQAIGSLMEPAIEMDRALRELRSLDIQESALTRLRNTALKTSVQFGGNAADIVSSASAIYRTIDNLNDIELSRFTAASAVLAKATRGESAAATEYFGRMYSIFRDNANAMGKSQWVEQLAGQTAVATKIFRTSSDQMGEAFKALGVDAQSAGVGMAEQMAVLGTLQATMDGGDAGGRYKSFLENIGKAQTELGLQFTDSNNRLLPMVQILEALRGKFGDTFDQVELDKFNAAFGGEAAGMVRLLMQNVDGLRGNIDKLGRVKGMDQATRMAEQMADPWERLGALAIALKTVLGSVLQPVLVPLANRLIDIGMVLQDWSVKFPNITRLVGIATLTVFGLVAAFSAFAVIGGVAQLAMLAFTPVLTLARTAMLLFNAALWANPITWIVAAVVGLIVALGALVYYWDDVKAVALDFVESLMERFERFKLFMSMLNPFALLGRGIDWLIDKLNLIPGINIDTTSRFNNPAINPNDTGLLGAEARGSTLDRASIVPPGGLQQDINNNGRSTIVEKMEIHTSQPVDGFLVADQLAMA